MISKRRALLLLFGVFLMVLVPGIASHHTQTLAYSTGSTMAAPFTTSSNNSTGNLTNGTSPTFSWNFLKSMGSGITNGANWLYQHSIGAFGTWASNKALSLGEQFARDAVGAFLTAFALLVQAFDNVYAGGFAMVVSLASSMGVIGPMAAIILFVAMVIIFVIIFRLVVDIL